MIDLKRSDFQEGAVIRRVFFAAFWGIGCGAATVLAFTVSWWFVLCAVVCATGIWPNLDEKYQRSLVSTHPDRSL